VVDGAHPASVVPERREVDQRGGGDCRSGPHRIGCPARRSTRRLKTVADLTVRNMTLAHPQLRDALTQIHGRVRLKENGVELDSLSGRWRDAGRPDSGYSLAFGSGSREARRLAADQCAIGQRDVRDAAGVVPRPRGPVRRQWGHGSGSRAGTEPRGPSPEFHAKARGDIPGRVSSGTSTSRMRSAMFYWPDGDRRRRGQACGVRRQSMARRPSTW